MEDEQLVIIGGPVKSLGGGRVGGFLVRFTDQDNLDLEGDYFDETTDYMFDFPGKSAAWFSHAIYPQKQRLSNDAELSMKHDGDEFGNYRRVE